MAIAFFRKASSLRSGLLLFAALLVTLDVVAAQYDDDERACDDSIVHIVNQTDIDFYKTCPVIDSSLFFIDHEFKGPFELSGVTSLPSLSSGYYGPKLEGSDEVEDGVTSASMPDLKKITANSVLFGYLNNLTSISFPKLETVAKDFVVTGSYGVPNLTLPALTTAGAILLDGQFDEINLPSLKTASYLRVLSTGNISCPALGAAFASVTFTATEDDLYQGFTCWTGYEDNSWNSSDPENNPTAAGGSSPTGTSSGSVSAPSAGTSAASVAQVGYSVTILLFSTGILLLLS